MSVDFTNYTNQLQARLNAATSSTTATELLLLAKAAESSIGNANVANVNAAGTTQVASINSAASTKVGEVNAAGSSQITSINNAGAAWLNGSQPIPAGVVSQIRGPQGIQGVQGPVGATFSVSGSTLTINW